MAIGISHINLISMKGCYHIEKAVTGGRTDGRQERVLELELCSQLKSQLAAFSLLEGRGTGLQGDILKTCCQDSRGDIRVLTNKIQLVCISGRKIGVN